MDGRQGRLSDSLRWRLSFWLASAILGVAVLGGAFSYTAAFEEAIELQDDSLRQVASLLDSQALAVPSAAPDWSDAGAASRVLVRRLSSGPGATPGEVERQLAGLPDGLYTRRIAGIDYRLLLRGASSGARVLIAQQTSVRDEIARDSALHTTLPLLLLLPLLLVLLTLVVRSVFSPVAALAREIGRRSDHDLHPLESDTLPAEMRPFAAAINQLLLRVAQAMQSQRRFVADAAHELRTPFTALSLQAEALANAGLAPAARIQLAQLRAGLERGRRLIDQLLALARAQSPGVAAAQIPHRMTLQCLFRRILEDLMPLADARNIDIGVTGDADAELDAAEMDLLLLLRNIVDNAIRYTPNGGRVDLGVELADGAVTVKVSDTGPGIPPAEHRRVFDPFYRTLDNQQMGSGLGLSIASAVAQRIGARIDLAYADPQAQCGLCVCIVFGPACASVQRPTLLRDDSGV